MKTITYTEARNKLNKIISSVAENSVPYVILGTKGRKDTVLISKEDFDNLLEHLHISGNSGWIKSIQKGIDELDAGKGIQAELDSVLKGEK